LEDNNTLHTVLRKVADNPTEQDTIGFVLHSILKSAAADAGFVVVFDEAEVIISHNIKLQDVTVEQLATALQPFIDTPSTDDALPDILNNQFNSWVVTPIAQGETTVGALVMLYCNTAGSSYTPSATVTSLINVLRTIVAMIHAQAKNINYKRSYQQSLRIATHDMRSPLTSAKGFGSMLESEIAGELNEKQSQFLSKIMSGISRLTLQIDNIQDIGRYDPDIDQDELERSPANLVDVVHQVLDSHLLLAQEQDLTISFHAVDTLPIVNINVDMMKRAIANIIDNAIKYTPRGGKFDVAVRHVNQDALIVVEDNGLGVSPSDANKIFDRHYRVQHQEHRRIRGSGLGLFIVKNIARKHDGDAWVESVESQGSTFFIRIPLVGQNLFGDD
jgi:signal transduction histidine kinase